MYSNTSYRSRRPIIITLILLTAVVGWFSFPDSIDRRGSELLNSVKDWSKWGSGDIEIEIVPAELPTYNSTSDYNQTLIDIDIGNREDDVKLQDLPNSEIDELVLNNSSIEWETTYNQRPPFNMMANFTRINEKCFWPNTLSSDCINFLLSGSYHIPISNNDTTAYTEKQHIFHVYWKGEFSDKLSLMAKSFLYTQPLNSSKLMIWLDGWGTENEIEDNKYSRELLKFVDAGFIEYHRWNSIEMLEKAFEGEKLPKGFDTLKKKLSKKTGNATSFSDMVRFFVLKIYGGIYVDTDTILLRDMSDLFRTPVEFSYQWSFHKSYNTAILRMWQNSTTSRVIINKALQNIEKGHKWPFHPMVVTKYIGRVRDTVYEPSTPDAKHPKLFCFPSAVFDPLWMKFDRATPNDTAIIPNLSIFSNVFNPDWISGEVDMKERGRALRVFRETNPGAWEKMEEATGEEKQLLNDYIHREVVKITRDPDHFYRGAYTYHWHNNWKASIPPSSWMGRMLERYNQFIDGYAENIYGETFNITTTQ